CGLSTPVCLPPLFFWYSLMAATMRSLTSPVIAPLYSPTQARSDCSASRSPCAMALAVSAGGFCPPGGGGAGAAPPRLGPPALARALGLAPPVDGAPICASAETPAAMNIKVAVSHDLMTNPGEIERKGLKHICLVGNNGGPVQGSRSSS